jgi:hypothetical protein
VSGPRRAATALLVAVAIAVLGGAAYAYGEGLPPFGPSDDAWTGVFLTNGQAYFGHYYAAPGDFVRLREVYYVLATQLQSQDPAQIAQTQLSLQKLGAEIHGPQSDMRIAKSQILFVVHLRPDSPLVQSIAQQKAAPPVQLPPPTRASPSPAATASPRPASPSPSPTPSPTR